MSDRDASSPKAAAPGRLEAVLFDMDGVVTDTAQAHAAAWKQLFDEFLRTRAEARNEEFRSFDAERDYREFVDGKPRHDGIRSFLRSRGIDLPEGNPDDQPGAETVSGLGKRKQHYFRSWLKDNQVWKYPGTLKLIHDLHEIGVRTAVFSSSRNAEDVLHNASAFDLFDVKVDGNDLAALSLPGKPDPAMLHEAASRLGVKPGHAAVVEDAIAGVEAGARGGFGLVIGVDRGDYGDALKEAGAHIVVRDLSELLVTENHGLIAKTLDNLPSIWDCEDEVRARLSEKTPVVFLDYDGTLTPMVEDHSKAFLANDMRAAVAELAKSCQVTIVSGRDLHMVKRLVKIGSVFFAGSHGFEIAGPDGSSESLERGVEFLPQIDEAERRLRKGLSQIAGHAVERKRFSIAVHYRQASDEDMARIEVVVDKVLSECGGLHKGHGRKVFRIQPNIDWDKGHAVLWLLERFELDDPDVLPIYVGDDITDEDAFHALSGRGLTVVVRDHEARQSAADYTVANVGEVKRLIETLAAMAAENAKSDRAGDEA